MSDVRAPIWGGGGGPVVPPELAGVHSLGPVVKVHRAAEAARTGPIAFAVLGVVMSAVAVLVGVMGRLAVTIAPGFVGVLLLGLGVRDLFRLAGAARQLVTYSSGFAAVVGSKSSLWPYAEIESIVSDVRLFRSERTGNYHTYRYDIRKRSGESIALLSHRLEDVKAIARSIKDPVFKALLPELQKAWDAQQTLTFGAVKVSRTAIEHGGRRIAWADEVRDVVVKNGRLIVTPKAGPPLKVRASQIPNLELLGSLIGVDPASMDLSYL